MMVDSDDYISPNMIEVLYRVIAQSGTEISIGDYEEGEDRYYTFDVDNADYHILDFETVMNKPYDNSHDALRYIAPWGKLYKKELFNGLQYPEGKILSLIHI